LLIGPWFVEAAEYGSAFLALISGMTGLASIAGDDVGVSVMLLGFSLGYGAYALFVGLYKRHRTYVHYSTE